MVMVMDAVVDMYADKRTEKISLLSKFLFLLLYKEFLMLTFLFKKTRTNRPQERFK